MKRYRQTFEEIEASLSPISASWLDSHAEDVVRLLRTMPKDRGYAIADVEALLEANFAAASTAIRLFLDLSKDEFSMRMKEALGKGGTGISRFNQDRKTYLRTLENMGLPGAITSAVNYRPEWYDILQERLKGGRGSAIKGQTRGRGMEDFVEQIAGEIFRPDQIAVRCRFAGATGQSDEKADFAIPSAEDPGIIIEVKAYGATGSKQTDVLGDIARIVDQKRHDTSLLLVTDGITWKQRPSDLRKLIALQNEGKIDRIYTKSMAATLREDLSALRVEKGLD